MGKTDQKLQLLNILYKDLSSIKMNLPNDFGKSSEEIVYNRLT
jgi:hypothetical protein